MIPTTASFALTSSVADADVMDDTEVELPEKSGCILPFGLVNVLVEEESLSLM